MLNITLLLAAIATVESGNNDQAVGKAGELGRYQISRTVWRQHSKLPFHMAKNRLEARKVAERHIKWIRKHLPEEQRDSAFRVALAWNMGLKGATEAYAKGHKMGEVPMGPYVYACRVSDNYLVSLCHNKEPK